MGCSALPHGTFEWAYAGFLFLSAAQAILWLHRSFYEDAPEAMLTIQGNERSVRMTPGEFRAESDHEVSVGRHLPPSANRVEAFMAYFEQRYRFKELGSGSRILAIAAAHHRLYTTATVMASPRTAADSGDFADLSELTSLKTFIASFAGHIAAEAAREA